MFRYFVNGIAVTPYITIDIDKIEHNTRQIVSLCATREIKVSGVTKATCGYPQVANAMLRGGVISIADSRFENIIRMKNAGITCDFMLLRLPPLSAVETTVQAMDISVNSELDVLEALSKAAHKHTKQHKVILMVDLGDLREGIWIDELIPFVQQAIRLTGIKIVGLGTNLACFSGVVPSEDNMTKLVQLVEQIEATFNLHLDYVSGANSSALQLISSGQMPARINHARIGEAILLGRETIKRKAWPNTFQDAFTLYGEVLEVKDKPSLPVGSRGQDAFGQESTFADRGKIRRALVNIGREDVVIDGITPLEKRIQIIGASSGYLALDVTNANKTVSVGDQLAFSVNYSALLAVMTSEYVEKRPINY